MGRPGADAGPALYGDEGSPPDGRVRGAFNQMRGADPSGGQRRSSSRHPKEFHVKSDAH